MILKKPYTNKLPYKVSIKGYDNYIIGEDGCVYRKLKPRFDVNGYEYYDFSDGHGNAARKYMHRLIAEYYIPRVEGKNYVNHIDGNKKNNSINNLEWVTPSENSIHSVYVLGNKPNPPTKETRKKMSEARKGKYIGVNNFKSKPVICVETGKKYSCFRECAEDINGTVQGIYDVIHKRYKKHRKLTFVLVEE